MTGFLPAARRRHAKAFSDVVDKVPAGMWIAGRDVESRRGERVNTIDPTTQEVLTSLPLAGRSDVEDAVAAAASASVDWTAKAIGERAAHLEAIADYWRQNKEELITLSALDTGMPRSSGRACDFEEAISAYCQAAQYVRDVRTVIDGVEWLKGRQVRKDGLSVVEGRIPFGVVGVVGVWNFVSQMTAWDTAMALATGNCVVFKPSENAPLVPLLMAKLASDAGLPAGVLNVVTGDGVRTGRALSCHPRVDLVSMTGSITAARDILRSSADSNLKDLRLELGGKSPLIVLPDADLTIAAGTVADLMLLYQAQNCVMCSRVYVVEHQSEDFLSELESALRTHFRPGDPLDEEVNFGPMISGRQHEAVTEKIRMTKEQERRGAGVRLAFELSLPSELEDGWFIAPTVFICRDDRVPLARDETFGPVITVHPYQDENEAVMRANDTGYGLGAGVLGTEKARVMRVANRLHAGVVYVNGYGATPAWCHFGGIKMSGFGGGGAVGIDSVDSYTVKTAKVSYL